VKSRGDVRCRYEVLAYKVSETQSCRPIGVFPRWSNSPFHRLDTVVQASLSDL